MLGRLLLLSVLADFYRPRLPAEVISNLPPSGRLA
jgi:hypothetical protein